jgi:ESX secretion system protein EccA
MKFAEDHRHDTFIAMAGYAQPMNRMLSANPGLRGRFPYQLKFDSNTPTELIEIAQLFAKDTFRVILSQPAIEVLASTCQWLCATPANDTFAHQLIDIAGNGRFIRNAVNEAAGKMKDRNVSTLGLDLATEDLDALRTIAAEDMRSAITEILESSDITTTNQGAGD